MINKPVVLITARCHTWLIEKLEQDYDVQLRPDITINEMPAALAGATGLIVTTRLSITKELLDGATQLKWIGRLGSGLELIDVAYAQSKQIKVVSSPEGNRNAVAEHALGMLLSGFRKIHTSFEEIKQGIWLRDENRGIELYGKTVGIIGFGNTGSQLAKLLQPFDVTVLAYDPNRYGFANGYIKEASLEHLQRYADVISFHVPLNQETRYMANKSFFARLQKKPWLLNTSRGKVVHLPHLKHALEQGLVSGAALDVLDNEKLSSYTPEEQQLLQWLCAQPNVLLTPHIAGYSHEAYLKMAQVLYQKIITNTPFEGPILPQPF